MTPVAPALMVPTAWRVELLVRTKPLAKKLTALLRITNLAVERPSPTTNAWELLLVIQPTSSVPPLNVMRLLVLVASRALTLEMMPLLIWKRLPVELAPPTVRLPPRRSQRVSAPLTNRLLLVPPTPMLVLPLLRMALVTVIELR
ncbi:MAG: hypothetical protein PCFJNLEI_03943 [Verrucomicrobiae bacterium]|nr:hypothetical protein [Verrucomicrobiae bacterium]